MFKKFFPKSPDPSVNTGAESANAKFGHLNALIEYINNVPPGSGIESVSGSAVDNTDPLNPVVNIPTGYLPLEGGTMDSGATIDFVNGSKLKQGTTNQEKGGNNGISFKCSLDYELKWEAGRLYIMEQDGQTIRESLYNFNNIPSVDDDAKSGYTIGSRWKLDDGTTYICTNSGQGSAEWIQLSGNKEPEVVGDGQVSPTKSGWNYSVVGTTVTMSGDLVLYNNGGSTGIENGFYPIIPSSSIGTTWTGFFTTSSTEPITMNFSNSSVFNFAGYSTTTNITVFLQYQLSK